MSQPAANPSISEITFTRSRHAQMLAMGVIACLVLGVTCLYLRSEHVLYHDPLRPPPPFWLCVLPLPIGIALGWAAWMHLRRPYLVVSRLGLEIHTLIEQDEIDHITWVEIKGVAAADEGKMLILTLNTDDESKVFISAAPIHARSRKLLMTALERIMEFRAKQVTPEAEIVGETAAP
jgi:hypothetical protein